jgi:hypothetical protein
MSRTLVNRRSAGDFTQPIALLSDSYPHVAMHAEAMDDGPILVCSDRSMSAERSIRTAGRLLGHRSQGDGQRSAGSEAYRQPYPLPFLYASKQTNEGAVKTTQTQAVPFANNEGKP